METNDNLNRNDGSRERLQNNSGRVIGGIVLLMIGMAFFVRQAGVELPHWLFSWPMILVVIGFYIGGRQSFRMGGWGILVVLGFVFLVDNILEEMFFVELSNYLWPTFFVVLGLYMILKPRKTRGWDSTTATITSEDTINSTSVFGGTKENIISKNFKGGDVTAIFGGSDLILSQADILGTVVIDSTTIFGGIKIVVPPHWNLKSEVICIFGGIDDKRKTEAVVDMSKTLILRGTCIFGGIDIKSH